MNNRIFKELVGRLKTANQLVQLGIYSFCLSWFLIACEPQPKKGAQSPKCNCWLDELTLNDTLFLTVTSAGCMHYHRERMKIYHGLDSLEASFTAWLPDSNGQVGPIVRPFPTKAKFIFADLISKGGGFVTQNLCTDVDSFQIRFKNELLSFIDADCELRQYHMLKALLLTADDAKEVHFGIKALRRKRFEVD